MLVTTLPSPRELRRTLQTVAVLDAILMPDWQYRYYSFDDQWGPNEGMGSMRDGAGSHYYAHFGPAGVFIVGLDSEAAIDLSVLTDVPDAFSECLAEPAFETDCVNFCVWAGRDGVWHSATEPNLELLDVVLYSPAAYAAWASEYYEREIPLTAVEAVFGWPKLTPALLAQLNEESEPDQLKADLAEIGYVPLAVC